MLALHLDNGKTAMEATKKVVMPEQARCGTHNVPDVQPPKLRLYFSEREIVKVTGLCGATLQHWVKRGLITPVSSEKAVRRGSARVYSAWQLAALCVLSAHHEEVRKRGSYIGRSAILRAMEAVADHDDALLVTEQVHGDLHVGETAAKIASEALPDEDLPGEAYENLRRAVKLIERKAKEQKAQESNLMRSIPSMS
jgi:hypothetical protein